MSTDVRLGSFLHLSPRALARIAGSFYLLNIITALLAFSGKGGHGLTVASGILATASYVVVTVLLYFLFQPVSRNLSLLAALFSMAGCAAGVLPRHWIRIHPLVFFGCYCLLIGYLIIRSRFLPRLLGMLMAAAGLGWLTFVSHDFANRLAPYHYILGGVGEGVFTLWLLILGVSSDSEEGQAPRRPR